ncbi:MAG: sporulation protein YtfJ [Clostridia bacterium]|nr:sporulation protein YtfJ [Clostridia bacterium]
MAEHVEKVLTGAIDGLKKMIDVDSVIGNPIKVSDETTIIPVSKVSMGFASGGAGYDKTRETDNFGGGGGGGVKITPIAFLVVTGDNVRIMSVSETPDQWDKIFTMIPELVDQVSNLINKYTESKE